MKIRIIFRFILPSFILILMSCGNNTQPSEAKATSNVAEMKFDTEEFANTMCKCLNISYTYSEEIKLYEKEGEKLGKEEKEKYEILIAQKDSIQVLSDTCINNLEEKYGDIVAVQEAEIKVAMENVCPNIASLIND